MELVVIGKIVNTHGLKGMLKVKSFTDFKDHRYTKGNTLYIAFERNYIPVTVESYKEVKTIDHLKFVEFNDINLVEKFKGSDLVIDKSLIHVLDVDEFYFEELIGMNVYNGENLIGICTDVRDYPQGEVLVIKSDKKNILIPFRKEFIKEVDKEKMSLHIIPWEGLL